MTLRLIIPTLAAALLVAMLAVAVPALAASEVTGTLTAGAPTTTATSSNDSLSGTVVQPSDGTLSGTVVQPSGGGGSSRRSSSGGGGGSSGGGNSDNGSVLGTSTEVPNVPNTGAGGNWLETLLVLTLTALTAVSGSFYLRHRLG